MAERNLIKHKQSRFFTIMLVPYSSTKVKSIKIPHFMLYSFFAFIGVLAFVAVVYSGRNAYLKSTLSNVQNDLINTSIINDRLSGETEELSNLLDLEKNEAQEAIRRQKEDYEDSLDYYDDMLQEMYRQIEELQDAKQEIYDKISSIDLPMSLASALVYEESPSIASDAVEFVSSVSFDKMAVIDNKFNDIDTQIAAATIAYEQLMTNVDIIKPYLDAFPSAWPARGIITSEVGSRSNPFTNRGVESHSGMDIAVPTGTNVEATGGGTVTYAGYNGNYGYLVIINHGFGITTYYGHNSRLLVTEGDEVARGDIIAKSGSTGRSTGPHVHYEVRLYDVIKNPRDYIKEN